MNFTKTRRWLSDTFYKPPQADKHISSIPQPLLEQLEKLEQMSFKLGVLKQASPASILKVWDSEIKIAKAEAKSSPKETERLTRLVIKELESQIEQLSHKNATEYEAKQMQPQKDLKLLALKKKQGDKGTFLSSLEKRKATLLAEINSYTNKKGSAPTRKSFLDTKKAVIGSFSGMMMVEGGITYMAIEELGLMPSIGIYLFIFIYGGLIGTLCHLSGHYHVQRNRRAAIKSALGAYFLAIVIILLRSYAQNEAFDWVLNLLNLLFVYACIVISKRLHERREYWQLKAALDKLVSQIDKLNAQLKHYPLAVKAIEDQFDADVARSIENKLQEKRKALAKKRQEYTRVVMQLKNIDLQIKAYRKEGTAAIEQRFIEGQNNQS